MKSTRYGVGAGSVCGECGNLIALVHVPAADGDLWIHTATRLPFCYRDPQHTQTAWPEPLAEDRVSPVLGFIVQCVVCPQQALVDEQLDGDWTCPRCAEVTGGFGDIDVAQAEPVAPADAWPADEWWLKRVRG